MQEANGFRPEELCGIFFTLTPDLKAAYPAAAARELGWVEVPMLCGVEIGVPGALQRVIRILVLWNTDRSQHEVQHVYLGEARRLRPDWSVDGR